MSAILALVRRSVIETRRVPSTMIADVIAPVLFLLAVVSMFQGLTSLREFPAVPYASWVVPFTMLQVAALIGTNGGVRLARDIEQGFVDRIMIAPVRRLTPLYGTAVAAAVRTLAPAILVVLVGFALGAAWPGIGGLATAVAITAVFCFVTAGYGVLMAQLLRSEMAGPMIQAPMLLAVYFSTSYAPLPLLSSWLRPVAEWNPITPVLEAARGAMLGTMTPASITDAAISVVAMLVVLWVLIAATSLRTR